MSSQVHIEFETITTQRFMVRDILPGPGWAPYRPQLHLVSEKSDSLTEGSLSSENSEDGKCLKGALIGIALECVAFAGVFGVWRLWHIAR